ncbi:MAG: hypothetical protein CVU84_06200 [Firmicutes bacterium HGW-Firmicutes-1]|jgi:two-component system LytT family response regulator|nr:MAG: hypothetical protein CVU84_06200 [Firmicutes bacterium HGW-Firmicutes-1]
MNILVVEDNEVTRKSLVKTLQKNLENCRVLEAATGNRAMELLENNYIDMFLLDIELPDFSGMDIAQNIRGIERYELIPIIFITTHITFLPKALHEYHCYDFIEKPFKMEEVIEVIKRLAKGISKEEVLDKRKYLTITNGNITNKILLSDLYFIEAQGRFIYYHSKLGLYKETKTSLKKVMTQIESLLANTFVRSHKAYIVNTQYVSSIIRNKRSASSIIFDSYDKVALIGETFKDELKKKFEWGDWY